MIVPPYYIHLDCRGTSFDLDCRDTSSDLDYRGTSFDLDDRGTFFDSFPGNGSFLEALDILVAPERCLVCWTPRLGSVSPLVTDFLNGFYLLELRLVLPIPCVKKAGY